MAQTTVTFEGVLSKMNQSLQIGDTLYYGLIQESVGFGDIFAPEYTFKTSNSIFQLGIVRSILVNTVSN